MFTKKDIARHFELCEEHYRYWWNLKQSRSMHYGYRDESTKNPHDALMNINKVMSEKSHTGPDHYVRDAGCSVGGSSIWLAKNIGCRVTRITFATDTGLTQLKSEDISKAITPSARRLYRYSIPGIILTKIYNFFFNARDLSKYHARTINIQYRALKKGLWKYQLFLAEKNK